MTILVIDLRQASEEVQLAAVKEDGYNIQYIENPSEEVQLAAVEEDGYSIEYIENPSEEVQLAVVKKHPCAIKYITNPSEAVQLVAVTEERCAIKYISNPSEAVHSLAKSLLRQDPWNRSIKILSDTKVNIGCQILEITDLKDLTLKDIRSIGGSCLDWAYKEDIIIAIEDKLGRKI